MKRLGFLLAVVLMALSPNTPVHALEGRVAAMAPPGTPWDDMWTRFRSYLDENNPDIELTFFIRGETGNEDEQLAALRRNRVQIVGPSLQGVSTLVPELSVAMAPFLFDSIEEVDFIYDNFLFEPVEKLLAEKGLALINWTEVGWTDFYANKQVLVPEDAEGLKIRGAPNIAAQVFLQAIGANSVPVGSVDLVPALQTGLVKGGTSSLIFHYYQSRAYATHVTLTHHSYDTGVLVANKEWYDQATPEERAAIKAAFGSPDISREAVRSMVDGLIENFREEGIIVDELTPEQRDQWVAKTKPAIQGMIDQIGGEAQMIYDVIMEGKAAYAALKAEQANLDTDGEVDDAEDPAQPLSE